MKPEPAAGVAVITIGVPATTVCSQSLRHVTPGGFSVTVPLPLISTLRVKLAPVFSKTPTSFAAALATTTSPPVISSDGVKSPAGLALAMLPARVPRHWIW